MSSIPEVPPELLVQLDQMVFLALMGILVQLVPRVLELLELLDRQVILVLQALQVLARQVQLVLKVLRGQQALLAQLVRLVH